ncbi:shugoshin 2 isoform X1 [Lemur catta]|uniref:shugoshin 2 isoform X1 n=1 Tax=Lemur catta TaxID=9447 RepID=UPI001E26DDDF|nr:shugoshin 2 isoform X1 [Lemur catta]
MECPVMETGSCFTTGIKRRVKDKRISKTASLNVSLASKIKTKIINNSSIFKISLKHNNRALAQALSREKENSRRITTEKMLLQKEVEKLNFENTYLRMKLNNLNKKLLETEAVMNNNLITAIEMSSLSDFHQSSFLLPASKKKRISKQCKLMRLPFARVPLTSNDDDDDDDDDKEKVQCDNNIKSKTSPDIPSSVSTRQPLSTQCNLEVSFLKENNQNVCGLDDSEHISSIVDVLPKESHCHSDQSPKSSLMSEMRNASPIGHRWEPSASNVTERKKRGSSWESNNLSADIPCVTDLGQQQISSPELNRNNEINDHINKKNTTMQRNKQYLPGLSSESPGEPNAGYVNQVQDNDDFQLQKTVYDADMDLTASEVGKIVTVSTGTKNKSNKKTKECGTKTFRKVKDSRSDKRRERSKRQFENSSDVDIEEKTENGPERRSVVLDGKRDSEDPDFIFSTKQLAQADILEKITLHNNNFDQDDRQNTQCNKKKKRIHVTNKQEETYSSQSSDKFRQESKFDMDQNSLTCNKSKASRQTFVIHKLEKDNLFPNQKDKVTISENLEVTNEFQTANLSSKDNGNLYDHETQNMLDLNEYITDMRPAEQNESKINKLRKKVSRKTKIISGMNQIYEDNDKDVHGPKKGNVFLQTQEDKETISGNLEVANEFQIPSVFTRDNGDCEAQDVLGLQQQITDVYPVQQNESKVNKKLRQKVNRKTEIISEVNHLDNNKSEHCPVKGNSFFLTQKDKAIIPRNPEDSSEFQTPAFSTKDSGNLCGYQTQHVLGVKKHVHDMQPACQNDSKIDKKLKQKVFRKTEIISEINQIYENDDKDVHDREKGNYYSPTQNDKETISENLQVINEFQTANLPTKDNGNLCYYETQNILDSKKHVTDMQPAEQNESKINKKLRHKVNRKTEIISEMNQICENNDKGMDGQESYTRDLDFKINKSKQRLECQGIIGGYSMEINSNEKESCGQISDPYQLVKKCKKESSGKAKNILTKGKNKSVLQSTDSLEIPISLEAELEHNTSEADSDPGKPIEIHNTQKQRTTTLNKKQEIHFVEVIKEGECQVKKVNKMTSKSKKRKTFIDPSPESHEVILDTVQGKSVDSDQADKENNVENEKMVRIKPDFYTEMFKSLSQIYSPNTQDSYSDNVREGLVPLSISSSKNLIIKENFDLEYSPSFQVSDDMHEKMDKTKFNVNQRAQKSGIGDRPLQDLTNTRFVSNNTAEFENKSEDLSSELRSRRRKCTPLHFKEPSLKGTRHLIEKPSYLNWRIVFKSQDLSTRYVRVLCCISYLLLQNNITINLVA